MPSKQPSQQIENPYEEKKDEPVYRDEFGQSIDQEAMVVQRESVEQTIRESIHKTNTNGTIESWKKNDGLLNLYDNRMNYVDIVNESIPSISSNN